MLTIRVRTQFNKSTLLNTDTACGHRVYHAKPSINDECDELPPMWFRGVFFVESSESDGEASFLGRRSERISGVATDISAYRTALIRNGISGPNPYRNPDSGLENNWMHASRDSFAE